MLSSALHRSARQAHRAVNTYLGYMRLVVQDHAQEAAVNRQPPAEAFVIDKAQLLELIHEMTDP